MIVLFGAVASRAQELPPGAGWVQLPAGFLPGGTAVFRLESAGQPTVMSLPTQWDEKSQELEVRPLSQLRLRFHRQDSEQQQAATVTGLFLGDASLLDLSFRLEATFPELENAASVRFDPRGSRDVVFLRPRGSRHHMATGVLDEMRGLGLDWGGISAGISVTPAPESAGKLAVQGRIPRGKETVLFSSRLLKWPAMVRAGPAGGLGKAGYLSGWSLPGGSSLVKEALRLGVAPGEPFGSYLEVGDGWQGRRAGRLFDKIDRSWLPSPGETGPDGPAEIGLASDWERLEKAGFAPALWLIPFGQSDEAVFEAQPEVFLRDLSTGHALPGGFLGRYVVDATRREGLEYLSNLFRALRSEGIKNFRLGGLEEALELHRRERARLADPQASPLAAVTRALEAMRLGAGEEAILAGDWGTPLELATHLDALRFVGARDRTRSDSLLPEIVAAAAGYHLHRCDRRLESGPILAWAEDGTEADRRAADTSRVLFAALTGRGLVVDRSVKPTPWSAELLRALSPAVPIEPLDVFAHEGKPRVWDLKLPGGGDLVGVFNWESLASTRLTLAPGDLGLTLRGGEICYWFDVLAEKFVAAGRAPLSVSLLPGRSRLLAVAVERGHPLLMAVTDSTFLATLERIENIEWDAARQELRWVTLFPPMLAATVATEDKPLKIHVACPASLGVLDVDANGGTAQFALNAGHLKVLVSSAGNTRIPVRARFASTNDVKPQPAPPMVNSVKVELNVSERRPLVTWSFEEGLHPWRHLEGFVVYRDGLEVERTTDTSFLDLEAPADEASAYSVAVLPGGSRSAPVACTWPRRQDAYLEDWTVHSPPHGVKSLCRRRSAVLGPLAVGGRQMTRGLGTRAPSRIDYRIDAAYTQFKARVGVDDAARFQGSVHFVILVDDKERWRSDVIRGGKSEPLPVAVPITGGRILSLVVEDAGDGSENDLADWGEARVVAE